MKKAYIYIAAALAAVTVASCDTKPEPLDLQPAYEYTDAYYAALRAYKESDHSICYVWFANYEWASPGCTFMGLPDSVDICNLWGGFPKDEKMVQEMYEMRRLKGTKLMTTKIIRLCPSDNNYLNYLSWAKDAEIPSFTNAYKAKYDEVFAEQQAAGVDAGVVAPHRPHPDAGQVPGPGGMARPRPAGLLSGPQERLPAGYLAYRCSVYV